jgi:hypothetical protein
MIHYQAKCGRGITPVGNYQVKNFPVQASKAFWSQKNWGWSKNPSGCFQFLLFLVLLVFWTNFGDFLNFFWARFFSEQNEKSEKRMFRHPSFEKKLSFGVGEQTYVCAQGYSTWDFENRNLQNSKSSRKYVF